MPAPSSGTLQHAIDAKNVTGWKSFDAVDDTTLRINFKAYQNDYLSAFPVPPSAG